GTFLPTFVTIPAVGTAATFIIFSGILILIASAYFISIKRVPKALMVSVVIFLICALLGTGVSFAFWEDDLAYEGESVYNYLQVSESDDRVVLSTNVLFGVQSVRMKTDELTGMYYDYALAAPAMALSGREGDGPLSILILGNGTGTFATQCARFYPGCVIEGVEIDGKISKLAYDYFDMSEDVKLFEYDGRAYLQGSDGRYDVIMVDAYQDITIPFQMSSAEFFGLVRDHLKPGGVMVVNMNMYSDGEGSINQYLTDTILSCFKYAASVDVPRNSNRELFACAAEDPAELLKSFDREGFGDMLSEQLDRIEWGLKACEASGKDLILTDDKAPVEVLGMSMIDTLIGDEIAYYKDIYRRDGLKAVIESVL
ncbi:MAG: fused MFS/spermidine synthase, partial [Firmicutes bacterium]|nr:fused MFS/spermidine synthase [Bacillota bacterium]